MQEDLEELASGICKTYFSAEAKARLTISADEL
jgi:hypothetical protein